MDEQNSTPRLDAIVSRCERCNGTDSQARHGVNVCSRCLMGGSVFLMVKPLKDGEACQRSKEFSSPD